MDYFYSPPSQIRSKSLTIDGAEFHHLSKVLRKKVGETIYVVDGKEYAYEAVLKSISRTAAECEIVKTFHRWNEPDVELKLAVALLKNPSRFDFLVEKCTELGVREIVPIKTERTLPRRVHTERLKKIALAAMKQCGRSFLPPIPSPMNFHEALTYLEGCERKLITHEKAGLDNNANRVGRVSRGMKRIGVLVGPEGGFTDQEVQSAIEKGFEPISLGVRRLRSETAAIAVVSLFLIPHEA